MTNQKVRFPIEAALIVAVSVGSGLAHVGRDGIYIAVGVAWAAVGLVEYRISRR
ncbi:MAG TPA: hypothetical protein VH210_08075 [Gaiellaceae bacterium]|jgi:hypothetical protein|nr:hypothetical protein [Gaiellaceae bacterium]